MGRQGRIAAAIAASAPSSSTGPSAPSTAPATPAPADATSSPAEPGAATETPPADGPEPTAKEIRQRHLDAIKAERRAKSAMRESKALAERATQFAQATQGWEQDPARVLQAAGIDPVAFYRTMTERVVRGQQPVQHDPVQLQVNAALEPIVAEMNAQKIAASEQYVIAQQVLPTLGALGDGVECLLGDHNGNARAAAASVFKACVEHFNRTNEVVPFADMAKAIEQGYRSRIADTLGKLRGTKAFGTQFAALAAAAPATAAAIAPGLSSSINRATVSRAISSRATPSGPTRAAAPPAAPPASAHARKSERIKAAVAAASKR